MSQDPAFGRAVPESADFGVATSLRHIHARYPALLIGSVRHESAGQRSNVLVINDTLVFRFPRTSAEIATLASEASILRAIRGRLPLPTPDPSYENLETRAVGTAFIGYPRLPGEPLWRETLLTQDQPLRHALAAQLAGFLQALHSVPTDALPGDLPVQDGQAQWADLYSRIRDKLFPLMSPASRALLVRHFESYLDQADNASYPPVLRHGDFGPSNILFDASARTISGIIEFGSAGLGDPALDVASVMGPFGYGEAFARSFAEFYPAVETLLDRARFYAGTFAVQEALWGLEHGDPEAFNSAIAAYR
jgi:aminoglycoside 2''-phosphotransferase